MKRRRRLARWALIIAAAAVSGVGVQPAAAAGAEVSCSRAQQPPAPRPGEVVIAGPMETRPVDNVVEIPVGLSWTPSGFCASAVVALAHPSSIEVGAGAALLLRGTGTIAGHEQDLVSAWGATDDKSHPVLFPSSFVVWKRTTQAQAVTPKHLFLNYDSCRNCALAHNDLQRPEFRFSGVAYQLDLVGADLQGATLHGNFHAWDFSRADLRDADLSNTNLTLARFTDTMVDRTDFDGANLVGAQFTALRFRSPPHFRNVGIGGNNGVCTVFRDTDLSRTGLTIRDDGLARCGLTPLLPGSTAPLSLVAQAAKLGRSSNGRPDYQGATFVATAADHAELAGVDLSDQRFNRARFVGFPVSFVKTNFSKGQLQGASFDLADLSGANFDNANLAGASFRGADLSEQGEAHGATFAGSATNLTRADFIDADISGASFVSADLSHAVFSHALAQDTNFNGVRAENTVFVGAHIYGSGRAFDSADNLRGADFNGAVLAGNVDESGGFNFTHTDLANATFDGAQCIGCNFTGSTLDDTKFIGTYLPGAIFTDVESMRGAKLNDAWLYCGDRGNSSCASVRSSSDRWEWVLKLGSEEDYGPVPFAQTNLANAPLNEVATCPDGTAGALLPKGCEGAHLEPPSHHAPPIPARCSAAGSGACPTRTSTLTDTSSFDSPLAVAPASPTTWTTTVKKLGLYVAFADGTIRLVEGREHRLVAGRLGEQCPEATRSCGDGGLASDALLGKPAGLAVGLDGSLYVADPALHRIRRIDSSGQITTVAGDGRACGAAEHDCGGGGPATEARLAGPYGVWVAPGGQIYIADGSHGIREVLNDGKIVSVGAAEFDVRSVVGSSSGDLYAATDDYLLKIDPKTKKVTKVVGTGTNGYNGNKTRLGTLAAGTAVQINHPASLSMALNGDVLFADTHNDLIRAYVPNSGHVINALAGVVADGSPKGGFTEDGKYATETKLSDPRAVATLANGLFVVADAGNRRVRKFGPGPR